MIALVLALAAVPAPAAPLSSAAARPRTGSVSTLIHSEAFSRGAAGKTQAFRVDYSAGLTWALTDRKACFFNRCHTVCDMAVRHKTLSRQLWWLPPGRPPVLAQNSPSQREYGGGVVRFERACASVTDPEVARGAADRLRPYQFADELIRDRPSLGKDADEYLILHPIAP